MRSFDERVVTWKKFSRFLLDTSSPQQPVQSIELSGEYYFSSDYLRKILENRLPRSMFSPHSSWRDVNYETKLIKIRRQHLPKTQILDFNCDSQSWLLSDTDPAASMKKGSPQMNLLYTTCLKAQGTPQLSKISGVLDTSPLSKINNQEAYSMELPCLLHPAWGFPYPRQ